MFELRATLPMTKDLRVRIKDFDLLSANDTIGETVVDLENRYLSRHNGLVGLPLTYCTSGICQWRDSQTPTQILEEFCAKYLKTGTVPVFDGDETLKIANKVFALSDFGKKCSPCQGVCWNSYYVLLTVGSYCNH